jgi:hypothetical protein
VPITPAAARAAVVAYAIREVGGAMTMHEVKTRRDSLYALVAG